MSAAVLLLALAGLALNPVQAAHIGSEGGYCHEWLEEIQHHNEHMHEHNASEERFDQKHEMVPDCDEHGNFVPKQCHVFTMNDEWCDPSGRPCYRFREGEEWCVCTHPISGEMDRKSISRGAEGLHCDGCPRHWTRFSDHDHDHCYRFIDSPKTWVEAESYCRFEGGHLTSIHCEETNRFLQGLTRGDTHDFPLTWVGGHNTVQACFWMWSDGQIFDYENWYKEESKNREHSCLQINHGYQYKWSAGCCNETLPFVCAKEMDYYHHDYDHHESHESHESHEGYESHESHH